MQRNGDPLRPGDRFLVRDNEYNLPATAPSIAFLNQLQDDLTHLISQKDPMEQSVFTSEAGQVLKAIESIKYGFSPPGYYTKWKITLTPGESDTIFYLEDTYAVHLLGETYLKITLSEMTTPIEIGPVTVTKVGTDILEFKIKNGVESATLYAFLEVTRPWALNVATGHSG